MTVLLIIVLALWLAPLVLAAPLLGLGLLAPRLGRKVVRSLLTVFDGNAAAMWAAVDADRAERYVAAASEAQDSALH